MYHYFYKITNNINNHFYYGVHNTDNLEDGYMGSGIRLHKAYKKYGMENFTKEILKFFDTKDDAFKYEAEVVTEALVMDPNCYNLQLGGSGFCSSGLAVVKDKDGNIFYTSVSDPRIKTGELVGHTKGFGRYINTVTGESCCAKIDDPRIKEGILVGHTLGYCVLKNKNNDIIFCKIDDAATYINNGYMYLGSNKVTVKDKQNNLYYIDKNDPRYISGELVPIWKGRKHSESTKQKLRETFKLTLHQLGEKNSQYGTCWVTKDKENKKINKELLDIYLKDGWEKGRYVKVIVDRSNDPTYKEIMNYYNETLSYRKTAKHFNMSTHKLQNIIKEYNLEV